jgi:hypothetical protein
MDCVGINAPNSNGSDPANDPFHFLRGFFISSANFPNQGPQLEYVNAGDQVNLSVRVYNYSLADMPPGTFVHVRFYYMPWNTATAQPVYPNGTSSLIKEVLAPPIPAFNTSSTTNLNWTIVGTPFDIASVPGLQDGDVSVVFWVVVWMQDGNGNLVNDLPNHGLTAVPPSFTSWTEAVNFECPNTGSCYSNNVGLFKQPLYIASAVQSGSAAAKFHIANSSGLGVSRGPGSPSVDIGKLELSASRVTLTDNVSVSAIVSAEGANAGTMSTNFYDGDPKKGGRLYDMERIPHIAEGSRYKVVASYRPNTCGTHQLFAVINEGKPNEVVRRAPTLRVLCNLPIEIGGDLDRFRLEQ